MQQFVTAVATTYTDADPYYDKCSNQTRPTIAMGGANVGNLLNSAGVSWGWFQGGFSNPGYVPGNLSTYNASMVCTGTHQNDAGDNPVRKDPNGAARSREDMAGSWFGTIAPVWGHSRWGLARRSLVDGEFERLGRRGTPREQSSNNVQSGRPVFEYEGRNVTVVNVTTPLY